MTRKIIFTDLDGTLLDAVTYSFSPAQPALELIRKNDIPLILCSSKTRAEMEVIRRQLGNHHPFITENGGGIFIPSGYFTDTPDAGNLGEHRLLTLGTPYTEIRRNFVRLRDEFHVNVRGFADMTVEEVSALTGLARDAAVLAKQRDFDEPFVFEGAPDKHFLQAIENSGLSWTQGRIFHIMGRHDKGRAVSLLKSLYEKQSGAVSAIGLGDSLNDLQMLRAMDQAVLVRHDDGSHDSRITIPCLLKTTLPGPAGWNEAVLQFISDEQTADKPSENEFSARRKIDLIEIFNAGLAAVDPYYAVLRFAKIENGNLRVAGNKYDLNVFERIVVVGAGKATARMAQAIESLLGKRISAGLIVVKDGHTMPLQLIEQVEAAHPVPNEAGMAGTSRILEMARSADEKTLVICLLSGGGSALLVAPAPSLTLQDKQTVTALLLKAGASIDEINAVRKHLSAVKGGRLAQSAYPAQVITLLLSDVIGDRLDVIASGPTASDSSTFAMALAVIAKYRLEGKIPARVSDYLNSGANGLLSETMKAGDHCSRTTHHVVVGAIGLALNAAAEKSRQLGFPVQVLDTELHGDVRDAARFLAQAARNALAEMQPGEHRCLLCGGETTVVVTGTGKGGRNQELALAFALEIDGLSGVTLLSAGTDGNDGPTDAAGALVTGQTAARARKLDINPEHYLNNNDSYHFFQCYDVGAGSQDHFITGPTGTNVMDMQLLLLEVKR